MEGVLDLTNKNTGDAAGDTSFVISRKNQAYDCRLHPNQYVCLGVAGFTGDDANSTDLVLEMQVEIDGQWGPYLQCNPNNVSDVHGDWSCLWDLPWVNPSGYPDECSATYKGMEDVALDDVPDKTLTDIPLAECCSEARSGFWPLYSYDMVKRECNLFKSTTKFVY